jgi:hypothetical protein
MFDSHIEEYKFILHSYKSLSNWKAYSQGYDAEDWNNPYPIGTAENAAWNDGALESEWQWTTGEYDDDYQRELRRRERQC